MALLIRPLRKSVVFPSSSSKILIQKKPTLHLAPEKQVSLLNPRLLPTQCLRTYISEMLLQSAFQANILRLLRNEIHYEFDRSPPNQVST